MVGMQRVAGSGPGTSNPARPRSARSTTCTLTITPGDRAHDLPFFAFQTSTGRDDRAKRKAHGRDLYLDRVLEGLCNDTLATPRRCRRRRSIHQGE